MHIYGTLNPPGEDNSYNGLYFTKRDIDDCIQQNKLQGVPVKIEHKGIDVGRVIRAWKNSTGAIDCVMEVNENVFEGAIVSKFVDQGVTRELSLGYTVEMQNSGNGICTGKKHIVEVSIVKKGAREKCFIHAYQ